jgi:hypothetical protein
MTVYMDDDYGWMKKKASINISHRNKLLLTDSNKINQNDDYDHRQQKNCIVVCKNIIIK